MNTVDEKKEIGALLQGILEDSQALLRQEVALARSEVRQDLRNARRAAMGFVLGAGLTGVAGLLVQLALVHLLPRFEPHIPLWGSNLSVGLGLAMAVSAVLARSYKEFNEVDLTPTQAIQSVKEDARWIAQRL